MLYLVASLEKGSSDIGPVTASSDLHMLYLGASLGEGLTGLVLSQFLLHMLYLDASLGEGSTDISITTAPFEHASSCDLS